MCVCGGGGGQQHIQVRAGHIQVRAAVHSGGERVRDTHVAVHMAYLAKVGVWMSGWLNGWVQGRGGGVMIRGWIGVYRWGVLLRGGGERSSWSGHTASIDPTHWWSTYEMHVAVHTAYLAKVGQWLGFYMGGGDDRTGGTGGGAPLGWGRRRWCEGLGKQLRCNQPNPARDASSMGWGSR